MKISGWKTILIAVHLFSFSYKDPETFYYTTCAVQFCTLFERYVSLLERYGSIFERFVSFLKRYGLFNKRYGSFIARYGLQK